MANPPLADGNINNPACMEKQLLFSTQNANNSRADFIEVFQNHLRGDFPYSASVAMRSGNCQSAKFDARANKHVDHPTVTAQRDLKVSGRRRAGE
jgi:hypothetical protein